MFDPRRATRVRTSIVSPRPLLRMGRLHRGPYHRHALPAGLRPTPGRSVAATARRIRELWHARPRTPATVTAGRVILISLLTWRDRSRSHGGGRRIAHGEDYERLTR